MTDFLCINKNKWDEKTCHPGGPIIKDLILSEYAGKDLYDNWNENERSIHMTTDRSALIPDVLSKLAKLNPALTAESTAEYIKCGVFECTTTTTTTLEAVAAGAGAAEKAAAAAELAAAEIAETDAREMLEAAQLKLDQVAAAVDADPDELAAAQEAVTAASSAVATAQAAVASATARVAALEDVIGAAATSKVGLAAGLVAGITAVLGIIFSVHLLRITNLNSTPGWISSDSATTPNAAYAASGAQP